MNQKINLLTVLAAGALAASVSGCELIAAIDRNDRSQRDPGRL